MRRSKAARPFMPGMAAGLDPAARIGEKARMACTVAIIDSRPAVADALRGAIAAQPGFAATAYAAAAAVAADAGAAGILLIGHDDAATFPAAPLAGFRRGNPAGSVLGLLGGGLGQAARAQCDRVLDRPARLGEVLQALQGLAARAAPLRLGAHLFRPGERLLRRVHDDGKAIVSHLTDKEAALLSHLARAPDHAATRDALLGAVWHYADGISTRTVESHVYRLRHKLENDPSAPAILVTTPDGYRLVPGVLSVADG